MQYQGQRIDARARATRHQLPLTVVHRDFHAMLVGQGGQLRCIAEHREHRAFCGALVHQAATADDQRQHVFQAVNTGDHGGGIFSYRVPDQPVRRQPECAPMGGHGYRVGDNGGLRVVHAVDQAGVLAEHHRFERELQMRGAHGEAAVQALGEGLGLAIQALTHAGPLAALAAAEPQLAAWAGLAVIQQGVMVALGKCLQRLRGFFMQGYRQAVG